MVPDFGSYFPAKNLRIFIAIIGVITNNHHPEAVRTMAYAPFSTHEGNKKA
jgi:hypothetical protein